MTKSFFFTMHTPYRWSSGAQICRLDDDDYSYIASLERAKELAIKNDTGYIGENTVVCTYGVMFDLESEKK